MDLKIPLLGRSGSSFHRLSTDGKDKAEVNCEVSIEEANGLGERMAMEILKNGGQKIVDGMNK